MTTTTITYSDGTTEVETSAASSQASQGGSSPAGQTYNSQGALSSNGASAAASGV